MHVEDFASNFFADVRKSAVVLARALTERHGRRHSEQIQQRVCRVALRIWGLTGDDSVRLPYVFELHAQETKVP